MHLKQKGYCYSVLIVYTITTITSHSPGRCEPAGYPSPTDLGEPAQPNSNGADLRHGRKAWGILTAKPLVHQPDRTARRRNRHDLRQTEVARKLPSLQILLSRDPDLQSFQPTSASSRDKRFKTRSKEEQEEGTVTYSFFNPRSKDCSEGEMNTVISGKFYMAGHLDTSIPNVGYQSDAAVSAQAQGGQVRVSWQRLQPVVKCGENAMTLTVRRRRAAQLLLDRVNTSSLPLSQLPSQCGYDVKTTWRDLTVTTPYDACHVTQEDDSYVLPLLWRDTPVKMSCPVSQIQPHTSGPSSLCCSPYGMTVTLPVQSATEELRVKVRGEWTPLELMAQQCGYTLDRQAGDLLIAAPFITCGITVKDGKYTLSLQIGEKAVTLACPVSPPEEFPQTHQPVVDGPHHPARGPAEPVPETLWAPWAPPFYLAPPYYPHPTYPHKYPSADTHHGYNPSVPLSLTPNPTPNPQPPPPESQPVYQYYYSYQMPPSGSYKAFNGGSSPLSSADEMGGSNRAYLGLGQTQATSTSSFPENLSTTHSPSSATGFPVPVEAPSLQPPSHTFNPYYHYYHHPKIPLPGPPQDPGAEIVTYKRYPEEQPAPVSHDPDFLVLPHYIYQAKAPGNVNSDQFPQPVTKAASHPSTLPVTNFKLHPRAPAPHAPYPQQPYPHYYFYHHPHISMGEAKRLASPSHGTFTTTNLPIDPQTTEPGMSAQPLPNLPQLPIHYKYNFHPYIVQPSQNPPSDLEILALHLYKDLFGPLFTTPPNEPGKPQLDGSLEGIPHPLLYEVGNVRSELEDKKKHSTPVVPAAQPLLPPYYPHFDYPPLKSPQSSHQHGSNPITNPPPEQPSSTTLSPNHNPNLYPYYHYYRMYYGPERLPNGDNHPRSPKEALDPQTSASPVESPQRTNPIIGTTSDNSRPQTTTESMYDIQIGPLHPYYDYYRHYYLPRAAIDEQEPHPAGSMYSGKATSVPPESAFYRMGSMVHPAGVGSPSMLQPRGKSSRSPSAHHISQQHPYNPFQRSDGEEAEKRPADEMRDRPEANSFTPAASPCGLGPVSNHDCSSSLACCSYPVDECTMGHHFVFVVPDSVLQPTVAPPHHFSEASNVSCTPQRLTSDLYTVPLDGCGVHRHMAGQTAVHLLEVQGIQALQQDHNSMHEGFPVRLMVECRSSPGSPGKVKFQVMSPSPAPPVQSTPATMTVQLRIATDESFTSYHPEAHQPLSLMRGRPVYLEVGLLNPPEPGLVLLVHYCLAYTHTPYASWMLIYDGCPSHGDTQVLPLPPPPPPSHPHQTRRLTITSFLSLPTKSHSHLDPELYFLCSTEVCSAADGDCTVGCISSPKSDA